MHRLPSGRYFCIQDQPLQDLLQSLKHNDLRLPELLSIAQAAHLNPYLNFSWLLPIGADTVVAARFSSPCELNLEGFILVNNGHTLASLPEDLDEPDRAALEAFWESEPCRIFILSCLIEAVDAQSRITLSDQPEDEILAQWWGYQDPEEDTPEIRAALEELNALAEEFRSSP